MMASESDGQEKEQQSPLLRIMNDLEVKGQMRVDHLQAAKQQYENLHGKLETLKKYDPQKLETISKNAKHTSIDLAKLEKKQEFWVICPALIQMMKTAVQLKLDADGEGKKELMLLINVYQSTVPKDDKKGISKEKATQPKGVDPNVIRFDALHNILYQRELWSKHCIHSDTVDQAQAEFNALRLQWNLILDKCEEKVRMYLSERRRKHDSLSSLPSRSDKPLHRLMERLSSSGHKEKEEVLREYIQLVAVSTVFSGKIDGTSKDSSQQIPDEGSGVDPVSRLREVVQKYYEIEDISEDVKDKVREEYLILVRLRTKYGQHQDRHMKEMNFKIEGKRLKDIVSKDQRKAAESVYGALQYAESGDWTYWREAAVEFCQLADVFRQLGKPADKYEEQGARPKAPPTQTRSALHDLILKHNHIEQKQFAVQQYASLRSKAEKLPKMREEENLAQSLSRLSSPADLPDDPDSTSYNILQILKAADPKMSKYCKAWDEYFFLLAEEQRFIQIKNTHIPHKEQTNMVQPSMVQASMVQANMVQAPCEREPQRIIQQESVVKMPYREWVQVINELERKTQEVEDLTTRLSRFASQQLTSGNPNIADLSDRNRPTKIGEMFGQLYDNEWSEAFDALKNAAQSLRDYSNKGTSVKVKSQKGLSRSTKKERDTHTGSKTDSSKDLSLSVKSVTMNDAESQELVSKGSTDKQQAGDEVSIDKSDSKAKTDSEAKATGTAKAEEHKQQGGHEHVMTVTEELTGAGAGRDQEGGATKQGGEPCMEPNLGSREEEGEEEEEEDFHVEELSVLQGIVMAAYDFCKGMAASQRERIQQDMESAIVLTFQPNINHGKGDEKPEVDQAFCKEVQAFTTKHAKDFSKSVGPMSCRVAAKKFEEEKLPSLTNHCASDPAIVEYANKCIELTWLMSVQDPPMKLVCPQEGSKFKLSEFAYHGRKGKMVQLCVWPALVLHENGPLVNKGHVLPKLA